MADLGDPRDVDRMVELAVAAPRQPVHAVATGADLDRGGAVVCGEVVTIREPADVAGLTDRDRGTDGTEPEHFCHRCSRCPDRVGETSFRGAHLLVDAAQILEMVEGKFVPGRFDRVRRYPIGE